MKHKQTMACDITRKVKATVNERDGGCCIICGKRGSPNAHFIGRAQGGLGIEQNIVTLCHECHNEYDNGTGKYRTSLEQAIDDYLRSKYEGWDRSKLIYNKWKDLDPSWRFDGAVKEG
jgi:5-methylcytosine-specific restriction endonuclease McrA